MRRVLPSILLLASVTLFSSCGVDIGQQLQYGNYNTVIRASLEKMKRHRKRDQYIKVAHDTYIKAMADDKQYIGHLKADPNRDENWGKIYRLYNNMIIRQEIVQRYLPITYNNGIQVEFEIYDLEAVKNEARDGAAAYHYFHAQEWLKQDSRTAGRNAFSHLQSIREYYLFDTYKDENELREAAIEMGTNKVLLLFDQSSQLYLPNNYLSELAYYDYERQLDHWTRLYRDGGDSAIYDYAIEVTVEDINISPQHVREIHYDHHKEVEDGVQPLLNSEGEFVTDTSGNIIQVPQFVTLSVHVIEWAQHRSANVTTSFEIYDMKQQRRAVHQRLEDHAVFDHIYANANGHLEILPHEVKDLIHQYPLPFPTDHEMILLTTESLRHQIANAIRRNDALLGSI